ncbi:MAG: hypothetical protein J6B29_04435 [Clostridia bacterium]|nr:hypothetical protein [Clostridia bacterium]
MKKKLLSIFIMLLCICMLVCFTACGDDNNDDDDDVVTVTVGETTQKALTNLIDADCIKIVGDYSTVENGSNYSSTMSGNAEIYVIKNNGVYEVKVVAESSDTSVYDGDEETYTSDFSVIIKDGKMYEIEGDDCEETDVSIDLTADKLIEMGLKAYNDSFGTEVGIELKTKEDVATLLAGILNAMTDSQLITKTGDNFVIEVNVDMAKTANDAITYIKGAQEDTLDVVIVELLKLDGITLTKEQLKTAITNAFADNLDFDGIIAKLEGLVKDITGETINIKADMDKAQTASGLTTAQLVNILNFVDKKASGAETDAFPAPEGTETLFDYIKRNYGKDMKGDDLAKLILGEEATLSDVGEFIIATLESTTLNDVAMMVAMMVLETEDAIACTQMVNGIFAQMDGITVNKLSEKAKVVLDGNFKLLSIEFETEVNVTVADTTTSNKTTAKLTVDYSALPEGTIVAPSTAE